MEPIKKDESMQDTPAKKTRQQETTKKKRVKPLYKRLWIWFCGSFVLLLLILNFALPLVAKYYLIDWLQNNGADSAVVDSFGWNPFLGKLWLKGVTLSRDGRNMMTQDALNIDVDYAALFNKNIVFSSASYTGAVVEIEQKDNGSWQIGTLTLPLSEKSGKEEDVSSTYLSSKDIPERLNKAWAFLADNVVLTDCQVHYKTPELDFTFHIDSAKLKQFSTREGSPAGSLLLDGTVNGEPVNINLHELQISPTLKLAGKVTVDSFDLATLEVLLHESLPFFSGIGSVNGNFDFSFEEKGLTVYYDGKIAVTKADVGAGSFRTQADNLLWHGKIHYEMPRDSAMLVVTDGLLHGNNYSLQIPDTELDTSVKQVKLSGETKVSIGSGVQVDHTGELTSTTIAFALPMLQTTEDALLWNGHVHYDLAQGHLVQVEGNLNITAADYAMPQQSLYIRDENIAWTGNLQYQGMNGTKKNEVAIDGKLSLAPLRIENGSEKEKISALASALGWDGKISFFQLEDGGNTINTDGILSGEALEAVFHDNNLQLTEKKLQLASKTTLQLGEKFSLESLSSLKAEHFTLNQPGEEKPLFSLDNFMIDKFIGFSSRKMLAKSITATNLQVKTNGAFPLHINIPAIRSGELSTSDLEKLSLESLSLTKPEIVSQYNGKSLLTLDKIALNDLQANIAKEMAIAIAGVNLKSLVFLGEQDGDNAASFKQAKLRDLHWSEKNGFLGEEIDVHDLTASIIRDSQGNLNVVTQLAAMQNNQEMTTKQKQTSEKTVLVAEKPTKEPSPIKLKLAKVRISENSHINFKDYTLKIPYQTNLEIDQFQITDIDSTNPENQSAVKLSGTLERRSPITIEGKIWPFSDNFGLDLSLKLKNYPLQNLSSYTIQSIGVGFASGELQVDSSVLLQENYLKNKNQLLLRKLQTKMVSKELAEELNNQLPVSLDTALSLLRDKNDAINLSIPLNGRIDKLHVGLADIITTALGKAVVPALTGYAIYTLGPYGALAYAGVKLGEDLLKEKDLPLIFLKGETDLVVEQKKVLEPLGKKMQEEKKKDLQICPIVASWELMSQQEIDAVSGSKIAVSSLTPDMQQRLEALGQKRADNIQHYFMEEFSIDKSHLLICTTVIKEEKKFLPLVTLRKE